METQSQNPPSSGFLKQMEDFFETYLHKKAPFHLPPNVKEIIVKFGPWLTLVIILLALPVILMALGLSAIMAPVTAMYGGMHYGTAFLLHGIFALISLILEAVALPGLFARTLKSWHLVYYAVLVSAVGQLFVGNIIGMIIGTALSLYVLLEIKEYYR